MSWIPDCAARATGETDEFGLPVRYNWASEYRGKAMVVYGHTPVPEAEWLNNTVNIDTGAVFGGKLTVLRYPEREFLSIAAAREYATPIRPFVQPAPDARSSQQILDDVLDLEDVTGKRIVETRLHRTITIREENSIAALEVMSRFATDPHWLSYLPPTMSPSETSSRPDYVEYPTEAFEYFRKNGVQKVVCEEKHMGSRAVVVVCRGLKAARERFGVIDGRAGVRERDARFSRTRLKKLSLLRVSRRRYPTPAFGMSSSLTGSASIAS